MSASGQIDWDSIAPRADTSAVNWDAVAPRATPGSQTSDHVRAHPLKGQNFGDWLSEELLQPVVDAATQLGRGIQGLGHPEQRPLTESVKDVIQGGMAISTPFAMGGLNSEPAPPGPPSAGAPSALGTALKGGAAGAVKALPKAAETSIFKYTGIPQIVRGAYQGAKAALKAREEAMAPPAEAPPQEAPTPTVTPVKTPGQSLAESDGKAWASLGQAEKELYEQIASYVPQFRANAAEPQNVAPKPPRNFEEYYGVPTSQQAVPRGTTPQPAAEVPPSNPTPSAPVSAQPASAAAPKGQPEFGADGEKFNSRSLPVYEVPTSRLGPKDYLGGEEPGTVAKYRQLLRQGSTPPPIEGVMIPNGEINIVDGYHRLAAAKAEGQSAVRVFLANEDKLTNAERASLVPERAAGAQPASAVPQAAVPPVRPQAPPTPPPESPAAVPEQLKTSGRTFVKDARPSAEDYKLVQVPTAMIDAGWAKEGPAFYIPPGGGGAEIGGRLPAAKQFIESGQPIEAPRVSMAENGRIVFEDGRHRFAALRDAGDETTAVMVPHEQVDQFEALNKPAAKPAAGAQTPADIAKAAQAKSKADRFIAAIQRYNIDFPERQPITAAGLEGLGDAEKSTLTRALKSGGYLKNTETFTDTSFPYIVQGLKDAESGSNLAQQLAESIRRARANRASAGR